MRRGWLLYYEEDYRKNAAFADQFVRRCGEAGLCIELRLADHLVASLGGAERAPDFAINRTRDALLGLWLESLGCRVFNSAGVSEVCNDKVKTHLLARRLGIPQVAMAFPRNCPADVAAHGLGYPVVVKSPYGHGGAEVALARDERELLCAAAALACDRLVVQRLCGRPGVDVRVYVLGGEILQAVRRTSHGGGFRANLSLGGAAERYTLDDREREVVLALAAALRPDYAGIDFLLDADGGFLFNEAEDAVGSRALYQLGGIDVVGLYLRHIWKTLGAASGK